MNVTRPLPVLCLLLAGVFVGAVAFAASPRLSIVTATKAKGDINLPRLVVCVGVAGSVVGGEQDIPGYGATIRAARHTTAHTYAYLLGCEPGQPCRMPDGAGPLDLHRVGISTLPQHENAARAILARCGACFMTLKDYLKDKRVAGRDLRALFADVCGYRHLWPAQEQHIEAIQTLPRVAAKGGTGTGKSFVQGTAAALAVAFTRNSKALFGGPKREQAAKLSWLELQRAFRAASDRQLPFGEAPGIMDWYPMGKDRRPEWFAACMALSDNNEAASVKGMMHAVRTIVALDELEGIAPPVRDALDAGTTQDNAHYWVAFNPIRKKDAAGVFWSQTKPEGRIHYSAIECAEWQERTGVKIPGMPTLAAIEEKWHGREKDPLYYTNVLGEFPPESGNWVVVPEDWYAQCVGPWAPEPSDLARVGIGVDTAGGRAENIIAVAAGRYARIEWASREIHQTPRLVTEVEAVAERYGGRAVPIAVDIIGQGGKGVADQLAADGYRAVYFRGGDRDFLDRRDPTGLSTDVITWAWFSVRESVRKTIETGEPFIVLPDDPVMQRQLARRFRASAERRYEMAHKDRNRDDLPKLEESPDRGDALAMAWLVAGLGGPLELVTQEAEDNWTPDDNIVPVTGGDYDWEV